MDKEIRRYLKKVDKEYIHLKDKVDEYSRDVGTQVWCGNEAIKEFMKNRKRK